METEKATKELFVHEERFDLIKFGITNILKHESVLYRPKAEITENVLREDFPWLLSIRGFLLGQSNLKEIEAKYPKNWKEAVKERFAPRWFKRKWPVVYEIVRMSANIVYPELHEKLNMPNENHTVIVHKWYEEESLD